MNPFWHNWSRGRENNAKLLKFRCWRFCMITWSNRTNFFSIKFNIFCCVFHFDKCNSFFPPFFFCFTATLMKLFFVFLKENQVILWLWQSIIKRRGGWKIISNEIVFIGEIWLIMGNCLEQFFVCFCNIIMFL